MTKIPAWLRDKSSTVPKEIPAWLDDKPSTVPKEIPAWLDDKPSTVPKELPARLRDMPSVVFKEEQKSSSDLSQLNSISYQFDSEDTPRENRAINKEPRVSKLTTVKDEHADPIQSDKEQDSILSNKEDNNDNEKELEISSKLIEIDNKSAIMRPSKNIESMKDSGFCQIPLNNRAIVNEHLNEGTTQSAQDFLRNYGNIWALKRFIPIYWPERVRTPTHYNLTGKSRIDPYKGEIDQIVKKFKITVEKLKESDKTLRIFHGKGIILPVGLWTEAIDYLFDWDTKAFKYKLKEEVLNFITSGEINVFADNSVIKFRGGSDAVTIQTAVNKYLNLFGMKASKRGKFFDLSILSIKKFQMSGAKFVAPEVTDEIFNKIHASEILSKFSGKISRDELRMMILYGAEQIGWSFFTGGNSGNLLNDLTGGRGEWLDVILSLDKKAEVTGFKGDRISDSYISNSNEIDPFLDAKKGVFKNGKKIAEIDVCFGSTEWNGETRMYKTVVARGSKLGYLEIKIRNGIIDNFFNLLSCIGTSYDDSASLIKALFTYNFDISRQRKEYEWNSLSEELMSGQRDKKFIKTKCGEFLRVFKKSNNVSVGIFKKRKDKDFVRFEIKRNSILSDRMEFEVRSEVGVINESGPNCYGSSKKEPDWKSNPDNSRWNSPIKLVIVQDLEPSDLVNDIAGDIEDSLGGKPIRQQDRATVENPNAGPNISEKISKIMIHQLGIKMLDNNGGKWICNGKLTRYSLVWIEKNLMKDTKGVYLSACSMQRIFGKFVANSKKQSKWKFDDVLKDKAFNLKKYEFEQPIVLNGLDFVKDSFYTTLSQKEIDKILLRAQEIVSIQRTKIRYFTDIMAGSGLAYYLSVVKADEFWHRTVTVDRILNKFENSVNELRNSKLFPIGITDDLDLDKNPNVVEMLRKKLERVQIHDNARIIQSDGKNGFNLLSREIKEAWFKAWEMLVFTSITASAKVTGEIGILGEKVFNASTRQIDRVRELEVALMKASFIGYWVSTRAFPSLSDILYQPSDHQFEPMCLNAHFNILQPGCILGIDENYYAHINWFDDVSTDHNPREYIVSFPAKGDININGFWVYASYTKRGISKVASPYHYYSSIPRAEIDDFMKNIQIGHPVPSKLQDGKPIECLLFRPGLLSNWMWELVDATHDTIGKLVLSN